jgi:hypothetical protein
MAGEKAWFPEMKLHRLVISKTELGSQILGIYKSLTDLLMWKF